MLLTDLETAFTLLTRVPVGRISVSPDLARCVWAFPIVGLAVNGTGGLLYWLCHIVHMPPILAAVWTVAATLLITGAFHEDGLADTADGFGGGGSPARKLEIMRDSRIGSYGALALLLSVSVRMAAIAALGRPGFVMIALILAGMLGRSAMIVATLVVSPARTDGMGAAMGQPRAKSAAAGLVIAVIAAFGLLPLWPAITAVALGIGSALAVAKLAERQVGGYTGDILGATEVIAECVVLTVLASCFGL